MRPIDIYLVREKRKQIQNKEPEQKPKPKDDTKNYLILVVVLIFLAIFAVAAGTALNNVRATYSTGIAHWQAQMNLTICGDQKDLPDANKEYNGVPFLGTRLLSTRNDNIWHVEGRVKSSADITLDQFFLAIGVEFSNTTLMDKTNGDLCGDVPGELKMFVNDIQTKELESYVIGATRSAEDQKIRLEFS